VDERLAAQLALADVSDEDFVRCAFLLVLRRLPDDAASAAALESLRRYSLSRAGLIGDLTASDEFRRLRALDDGVARGLAARVAGERPHELVTPSNLDERPIEMAWTLGRYRGERRVLDVGYAFAEPVWLSALTGAGPRTLTGLDLVEREVPGMSAVIGDVRRMPFADRSFDVIFCISTLEHVGADNTRYGSNKEGDPNGPRDALRELRRVVTRGGRILLTVPCGEHEGDEWYAAHSAAEWRSLFRESDLYVYDEEEYARASDGWRSGSHGAPGVLCAELHPGRLRHELVRRVRRRGRPSTRGREDGPARPQTR
jgi:SAM-dependent methyltransferase